MTTTSLETAIHRTGSTVGFLRDSVVRPATFPAAEPTDWRSAQQARRTSCALFDQSRQVTALQLRGKGALRLLRDFGVITFAGFKLGKARQYVAVNQDGYFIGDATVRHVGRELFDVVGNPAVTSWLRYNAEAGGYDVTVEGDGNTRDRPSGRPKCYRYELQGPTAGPLIEKLSGRLLPLIRAFSMTEFTIAGHRVGALPSGTVQRPRFELFGPWPDGEDVLAAILQDGPKFGLVRAGARAWSTANLESVAVPVAVPAIFGPEMRSFRLWVDAASLGSLGGSMDSPDITDYYVTPYDIGYGWIVKFDHDFLGREALRRIARTPGREKVTLVWNPDDVRSLFEPGTSAKYIEMPRSRYASFQVDKVLQDGATVGLSLDRGYIENEKVYVSLATIDRPAAPSGTEVAVLWGEYPNPAKPAVQHHRYTEIRATVAPAPYIQDVRSSRPVC
jgi:vanillate/3-O-methylgallate O-demethylase